MTSYDWQRGLPPGCRWVGHEDETVDGVEPDSKEWPGAGWLIVRLDPTSAWHLHASGDPQGYGHGVGSCVTACGLRMGHAEVMYADLPPTCETCRRSRLWRALDVERRGGRDGR